MNADTPTVLDAAVTKIRRIDLTNAGRTAALCAYLVGQRWTEPSLLSLSCTSDGFLTGTPGTPDPDNPDVLLPHHDELIGRAEEAVANLAGLAEVAGLDAAELAALAGRWNSRVAGPFWAEPYRVAADFTLARAGR